MWRQSVLSRSLAVKEKKRWASGLREWQKQGQDIFRPEIWACLWKEAQRQLKRGVKVMKRGPWGSWLLLGWSGDPGQGAYSAVAKREEPSFWEEKRKNSGRGEKRNVERMRWLIYNELESSTQCRPPVLVQICKSGNQDGRGGDRVYMETAWSAALTSTGFPPSSYKFFCDTRWDQKLFSDISNFNIKFGSFASRNTWRSQGLMGWKYREALFCTGWFSVSTLGNIS